VGRQNNSERESRAIEISERESQDGPLRSTGPARRRMDRQDGRTDVLHPALSIVSKTNLSMSIHMVTLLNLMRLREDENHVAEVLSLLATKAVAWSR
jgi:hypothetical protein